MTLSLLNQHRAALGRPPLEACAPWDLALVEMCAQYGHDRWEPGVLEDALREEPDEAVLALLAHDPEAELDDLHGGPLADVWREAELRGLLNRL